MGLCESFERSASNVGWLHELEQSFLVKKSRFSDGASFVLHNSSASEICKYCYNTHCIYFSCHLHVRLYHLKRKLPFAISSLLYTSQTLDQDRIVVRAGWDSRGKISVMRDRFDVKMCWERDLDSGEQETSKAGAKKAYATLVHDQGSKVNCFNLTFFFNRVYTFAASAIASIQ